MLGYCRVEKFVRFVVESVEIISTEIRSEISDHNSINVNHGNNFELKKFAQENGPRILG